MTRKIAILSVALAVLAPSLAAQTAGSRERGAEQTAEADVFMRALEAISSMHQNAQSDSALWEAALQGMIESLNDPYAAVFTPVEAEAWEEETTGNYSGIGLQITQLNNEVTVTAVFRSTPAAGSKAVIS